VTRAADEPFEVRAGPAAGRGSRPGPASDKVDGRLWKVVFESRHQISDFPFALWLALAVVVGVAANTRGQRSFGWFLDKDRPDYFFLDKISSIKPFLRACVRSWLIRSVNPKSCADASTPSRPMSPAMKARSVVCSVPSLFSTN
jgi:hypothetical protein